MEFSELVGPIILKIHKGKIQYIYVGDINYYYTIPADKTRCFSSLKELPRNSVLTKSSSNKLFNLSTRIKYKLFGSG